MISVSIIVSDDQGEYSWNKNNECVFDVENINEDVLGAINYDGVVKALLAAHKIKLDTQLANEAPEEDQG